MKDYSQRTIVTLGDAMNWRAELRAAGVDRRPSNDSSADRGFIEQPGEGVPDKPPPSTPRTPPHSQRPQSQAPLVLRRPVTSLTPAPPPPERETRIAPYVPPPTEREETRQIRAALDASAPKPDPLPPPSEKPTEAQKPVRIVMAAPEPERQACGKRARRCHAFPDDFKAKVVARFRELRAVPRRRGDGSADRVVAKEFDVSQSLVHRWCREEGRTEMPNKAAAKSHGKPSAYSQEERDEWARKAMTYGRGGGPLMAKKAKVPLGTMHGWLNSYRARHPDGPTSQQTMMSSAPTSKVQSKPNGAHPVQLPPFLQGLDEYINQIVDARVKDAVKEVLRSTSLMELMKQ